jgi:hypothetical protein
MWRDLPCSPAPTLLLASACAGSRVATVSAEAQGRRSTAHDARGDLREIETALEGQADDAGSVARQVAALRASAQAHGLTVEVAHIFTDTESGAEFARRPGLVRLLGALKPRAFEVLFITAGVRVFEVKHCPMIPWRPSERRTRAMDLLYTRGPRCLDGWVSVWTLATFRCRNGDREQPGMRDGASGHGRGVHFCISSIHCADSQRRGGHGPARPSTSRLLAMTPSPTQRCIPLSPWYRHRRSP